MAVRKGKVRAILTACALVFLTSTLAYILMGSIFITSTRHAAWFQTRQPGFSNEALGSSTGPKFPNVIENTKKTRERGVGNSSIVKNTKETGEQERAINVQLSTLSPKYSGFSEDAGVSSDEPKIWVWDKERGLNISEGSKVNVDASCYPRMFAPRGTSAAVPSPCIGDPEPVGSNPVRHIFFLKTHKTGSLTLTVVLNRYALTHNLSVALRQNFNTPVSTKKKLWIKDYYRPLPPGVTHYDMITDHVRFEEENVRHFLSGDSVFISIVREPMQRFVSAFYFGETWKRLKERIPGPDPLLTCLSNMSRWSSSYGSMTHSRMAYDFGLDSHNLLHYTQYLQRSLRNLSRIFHLVMLTESFDESMVLLKRTLSWTLLDVLYVKFHVSNRRPFYNFTQEQRDDFEQNRKAEYALYRYFRSLFDEKIREQDESFSHEVEVFKSMRNEVTYFCRNVVTERKFQRDLMVESTRFSPRFRVTLEDCRLLTRRLCSIRDPWFKRVMMKRLWKWHKAWEIYH